MSKDYDLGKGIAALFENLKETEKGQESLSSASIVLLKDIVPNPEQPRKNFSEEELLDLKRSIEKHGVLQPILLRPKNKMFEIVAGERRFRAAKELSLTEIPAIIKNISDEDALVIALIENIQRANLSSIEEADSLQKILISRQCTQEELAKQIGKTRSYVTNTLRLLTLPAPIQEMVKEGLLSTGHARALIGKENALELAKKAVDSKMSVRDIEKKVQPDKPKEKDIDITSLENAIKQILSLQAKVTFSGNGGRIQISFKNTEEIERFIEFLYKR